jgi:predicted nucleotidyltransferase
MQKNLLEKNKRLLLKAAPALFRNHPISFAYLYGSYATGTANFLSDMDIGIYITEIPQDQFLELELSLALEIDKTLDHAVESEVRILNTLPLSVLGEIITNGTLIYSANEEARVEFETSVRAAYFDFLPVLQNYQREYIKHIVTR